MMFISPLYDPSFLRYLFTSFLAHILTDVIDSLPFSWLSLSASFVLET